MASTPNSIERDQQLLAIGKQCAHPSCMLVDFLPFKCQHCSESFCQEHFMVAAHHCPKYDESKHNRVAPNCPLCNTPVSVRPGQDPNVRMEEHFNEECSVMTGKSNKVKSTPMCERANCKKLLFSPIRCDKCRKQFCPSHRFPTDHNCTPIPAPSTSRPSVSRLWSSGETKPKVATSVSTPAAKITKAATPPSVHSSVSPQPPTSEPPVRHMNPFSKVDRAVLPTIITPDTKSTVTELSAPSLETTTPTTNPINELNPVAAAAIDFTSFIPRRIITIA